MVLIIWLEIWRNLKNPNKIFFYKQINLEKLTPRIYSYKGENMTK